MDIQEIKLVDMKLNAVKQDDVQQIVTALGSRTRAAEFLLVSHGIKLAARQALYPGQLDVALRIADALGSRHGLHYAISDFGVAPADSAKAVDTAGDIASIDTVDNAIEGAVGCAVGSAAGKGACTKYTNYTNTKYASTNTSYASKNYTNKGVLVEKGQKGFEKAMRFFYISKNEKVIKHLQEQEKKQNAKTVGGLLGYPQCCIEFFLRYEKEKALSDNDFADKVCENSQEKSTESGPEDSARGTVGGKYPFYVNILARYEDNCIISHFPCSFACKETQVIGKKYADALKALAPELFADMKSKMIGRFSFAGKTFEFAEH